MCDVVTNPKIDPYAARTYDAPPQTWGRPRRDFSRLGASLHYLLAIDHCVAVAYDPHATRSRIRSIR